jgi:hypothetical protein
MASGEAASSVDEQIPLFDDRLFWRWRHHNQRLAEGVSEAAFWDIVRLGGREAIALSTELAGYEAVTRRLLWFFELATGDGVERHEEVVR